MTFEELHRAGEPLLLPNAWDYASAVALAAAGFAAVGTTSLGVAAAHGLPDGHGVARAETLALARRLRRLPVPYTVDIEAGFADEPGAVAEYAAEIAAAGAAGVNLEDGRAGGRLAPVDRQVAVIRAVKARVPGLFLNARTDTHWLNPGNRSVAGTLARAEAYLAAGADGVFVPSLAVPDDIRTLAAAIRAPLNILYLPGRHTVAELTELGVRRISLGSLLFRASLDAAVRTAVAVREGRPTPPGVPSYAEIQRLVGEGTGMIP
jgi:2-methylisocitrate lyase-like PEP mutase family enzyme